jgi:hypothetical protein
MVVSNLAERTRQKPHSTQPHHIQTKEGDKSARQSKSLGFHLRLANVGQVSRHRDKEDAKNAVSSISAVLYALADLCQKSRRSQVPSSSADSPGPGPPSGRGSHSRASGPASERIVDPDSDDLQPSQDPTQGEGCPPEFDWAADAGGDPVSQAPSSGGHLGGEFTEAALSQEPYTSIQALEGEWLCSYSGSP